MNEFELAQMDEFLRAEAALEQRMAEVGFSLHSGLTPSAD
jgi:hypothetical protein